MRCPPEGPQFCGRLQGYEMAQTRSLSRSVLPTRHGSEPWGLGWHGPTQDRTSPGAGGKAALREGQSQTAQRNVVIKRPPCLWNHLRVSV